MKRDPLLQLVHAQPPSGPDPWVGALREGLRPLRATRHWSQAELAYESGLNRRTITRLERMAEDAPCPSVGTLQTLAATFGYAELAPFWHALHAAAQTTPQAATPRPAAPPDLSDGEATLLVAYRGCTPEQQMIITSIAAIYAAQRAAAAKGEAALVDLGDIAPLLGRPKRR